MVVLMKSDVASKRGLDTMATIVEVANVAGDVEAPLSQGARATNQVLSKTGIHLKDISRIDIEEDFACVVPITANAWEKEWGVSAKDIMERTNVPGGATAYGHPLAAGGCRSVLAAARQLKGKRGELGIATVSGGLANGVAVMLKGA
jgi:acetyl-CoA C-acetyltransferase